ncbi:MAG TPA: PAS domain S-box protein [Gaiellaceae bacterium]|nr:PAS domain S-box protein [Gaiellaceae bacterium]
MTTAFDDVLEGIGELLMEIEHADGASLSTLEPDGRRHFKVGMGADAALRDRTFKLEETLGVECLRSRDVVVMRDVSNTISSGARAVVLAPVEYDGAIRGLLGVRSDSPNAFTDAEVETVRVLGRAAAIAMRNAELAERYRELHEQAADAVVVTDAEQSFLEANEAAAALLWYSTEELCRLKLDDIADPEGLHREPVRTAELMAKGELRGERGLRRKDGSIVTVEFSSRVLEDGRVHTTMRDVSQRKRNEERLRTSLGRLHAIVATQQEISALELDPDAVTATIVERTQRLTGADGVAVQWFEGDETVYHHGSGIAAQHIGLRFARGTSLAGVAAVTGHAVYAEDTWTDPRVDRAVCELLGARSLICAPLYRDGAVAGVLSLMSAQTAGFDELAVETGRMMAEFVSTVIRNSNELEERRRLVEQLRTQGDVVQHMQTALWVWAPDDDAYRLIAANAASEAATGLPADEILGKTLLEILPNAQTHIPMDVFRRVADIGERIDLGEFEYEDDRIPRSVFSARAFPLPENRVAITFENITDRVAAGRGLQESEARFRGAFHQSLLGMALSRLDEGGFAQVNDRLAEMLGYSVDELMKLTVRDFTHPDDLEEDIEYIKKMKSGAIDSFRREKRYIRKDGSILHGELTLSRVDGPEGAPRHVVAIVQDITAQREAGLLFEATFERSVVPKIVVDDKRSVIDVNPACAELLGVTHDEAIGLTLDDLMPEEPIPETWALFMHMGALEDEVTLRRPDGTARRVEFAATANVRPGIHIAVVRDLTRQKELEVQLRQAQKMEAVGRLAGGIAHDFNNLLTAIGGYSEFLIHGLEDAKLRRHASEIKKAADRAAGLTGQLLAFSRRQVLQPRVLDLNAVVSDMDMMLRRLIGEDVELITMLDPGLSSIRADPTQLEQVIVNLAVNARDAMPGGGSMTIETGNEVTLDGAYVVLVLTDTGVGMTESQRQQLFDPFFTTKAGGTGLGLATVYGIVEQSGGVIEVTSAPAMGSSFRLLFPAVEEEAEPLVSSPGEGEAQTGTETVLLVEDETVVRHLVSEILSANGYTVLEAADGPSALELLRRHTAPVDLLVTDVVMPGMSGPEVAQAVTAMRPGTQVVYMSGYTDQAIGHHGVLEAGMAFLQKPFSADDLTRKVRAVLDGSVVGID